MTPTPTERSEPRRVTGRMVLVCLVAFFAVVAGVNGIMIRAAVSTFGGVETESSYKAGLAFAREEAAAKVQDSRRWRIQAKIVPEHGQQRIELTADDASHRPLAGLTAIIRLAHPTDRRSDVSFDMKELSSGRFVGATTAAGGQWDIVIELARDGDRVFRSRSRVTLRQG